MGLFKTAAKVAVASSVHGRIQRRQQQRWARQDAAAAGGWEQQHAAAAVGGQPVPEQPPMVQAQPVQYAPAQPVQHAPVQPAPAAAAPSPDMATKLEQLRQLGELRAAGVLTDAEFEAQKAAVLSQ